MLTVIRKAENLYYRLVFNYYGQIAKKYIDKMHECANREDYDEALYWENKIIACLKKRQKALDNQLQIRGYY